MTLDLRVRDGAVEVPLLVVPGSSRERIVGEHEGRLRVAVTAPPEGGAANRAVVKLLARALDLRASAVTLAAGAGSRRKRLRIEGLGEDETRARLLAATEGKRR